MTTRQTHTGVTLAIGGSAAPLATILRNYASEAEEMARRSNGRGWWAAARRLAELATEAEQQAERERLKKRKQRASGAADVAAAEQAVAALSRRAEGDATWYAARRTPESVLLRKIER